MSDDAKKRKLTPKQWAEIEALWTSGQVTYDDLAKKYGRAVSTFERHFKKHGVVRGAHAEATRRAVEEKLAAATVDEATVLAARIKETKEQHYTMSSNLAKLAWNELLQAKQKGEPMAVAVNNLKALDLAAGILKKTREERWAVLGLDRPDAVNPDELPELVVAELTDAQIQELRDRDHTEFDDLPQAANPGAADEDDEPDDEVVQES